MMRGLSEVTKLNIISLRRQGLSWTQIARQLKLTKGQVAGVLYRAGMSKPKMCEECGKNPADPPSRLCPGCQAYKEHTA